MNTKKKSNCKNSTIHKKKIQWNSEGFENHLFEDYLDKLVDCYFLANDLTKRPEWVKFKVKKGKNR